MAARLPLTQTLSPTIRALVKAASNCPVQQPRAISVRYVTPSANHPNGTKTASQTPATGQNYLDVPAHVTKQANISLMQDLHLPTPIQAATERLLTQKAAAILGPLALEALGPGAPQITGPNADGKPEIPLMQPQGAEAGPGGQVPAPAAAQIAPPMGTPGAPVPPDPSQAQGQAPAAPPPPNPMAPAPMAQKAALAALGDLPGQMPGAPAGMGQPGPDVGAGAMGAASPLPNGVQPGGMQAGGLGTGLPPQMPGQAGGPQMPGASAQPSTVPSRMGSSALAPVGLNPLPGTGAPPGGTPARNTPASNPINMYGPISMQGEVNGNAGFGVKNSPVPAKMAGILSALDPRPYAPSSVDKYNRRLHQQLAGADDTGELTPELLDAVGRAVGRRWYHRPADNVSAVGALMDLDMMRPRPWAQGQQVRRRGALMPQVSPEEGEAFERDLMAGKQANLRETVAARYPTLPIDGVMGLLKSLGLDHGRDADHFLQTISKEASIMDSLLYRKLQEPTLQGSQLMEKLAAPPLRDLAERGYVNRQQFEDVMAGKANPSLRLGSIKAPNGLSWERAVEDNTGFNDYPEQLQNMFLNPAAANAASLTQNRDKLVNGDVETWRQLGSWATPAAQEQRYRYDLNEMSKKTPGEYFLPRSKQPLHGQAQLLNFDGARARNRSLAAMQPTVKAPIAAPVESPAAPQVEAPAEAPITTPVETPMSPQMTLGDRLSQSLPESARPYVSGAVNHMQEYWPLYGIGAAGALGTYGVIREMRRRRRAAQLEKMGRVSAAGEGNIPYIIRPHTESGVEALKLQRYAYKGPRADSLLPPRYPAGDNGVKTTTSAK